MEVQSVINESALKEARKYLIKRESVRSVQLPVQHLCCWQHIVCWQEDRLRCCWQYLQLSFLWGIKNDREQTD